VPLRSQRRVRIGFERACIREKCVHGVRTAINSTANPSDRYTLARLVLSRFGVYWKIKSSFE